MNNGEFERWFEEAWAAPGDEELSEWFRDYLRTFTALARGQREDFEVLTYYYGVPLVLTTDRAVRVMIDEADVVNKLRGRIYDMRAANYGSAQATHLHTRRINANSVLLESDWTNYTMDGEVLYTFQATYGLTRFDYGWRITWVATANTARP